MLKNMSLSAVLLTFMLAGLAPVHAQETAVGDKKPSEVTDKYQQAMKDMNQKMKAKQKTGGADHDFIVMMIEHHKGAIAMGEILVKEGKHSELKALTEKAIKTQKEEIGKLEKILEEVKSDNDDSE